MDCLRGRTRDLLFDKTVDVCVIFEECDYEDVQPLLAILNFPKVNGTHLRVFPGAQDSHSLDATLEALDHSHAILIVLSDKACAQLTGDDARKTRFYQVIHKACERERQNKSRILPLFLYETIHHNNTVGLVRFSTWAYKCKDEEVRAYMEHIGSLQGVFSDPADWESKWEKLCSFWEESHNALVPLNFENLRKEMDWGRIGRTVCGTLFSCCILVSLCFLCCTCKRCAIKWLQFRNGVLIGNVILLLAFSIALLLLGVFLNSDQCADEECEEDDATVKRFLYWFGSICGFIALLIFVIARFLLDNEEKILARNKLARKAEKAFGKSKITEKSKLTEKEKVTEMTEIVVN